MTVEEIIAAVGFLIARYLHIVCSALLVGGTLFYEMVVPVAVEDMPEGQQLAVMGRSRWVFRWIVWVSTTLLVGSGIFSTIKHWPTYTESDQEEPALVITPAATQPASSSETRIRLRSGWWWVAHASTGCIAVLIALSLTWGRTPPSHPVQWMRLNLVILMIVIFLGSVARQVRLALAEREQVGAHVYWPVPLAPENEKE